MTRKSKFQKSEQYKAEKVRNFSLLEKVKDRVNDVTDFIEQK